ncbi:hypothetical protein XELAEV_18041966mg [Xenopus laevis]|uniref:Uncharacterized protein n=1 Tax=Xenopus laevis TaxID=8355 RepID=A0A974C3D0_XENLA|nr:hypothetical protein XELAEV_18041966mg [Xenopus laevis]
MEGGGCCMWRERLRETGTEVGEGCSMWRERLRETGTEGGRLRYVEGKVKRNRKGGGEAAVCGGERVRKRETLRKQKKGFV